MLIVKNGNPNCQICLLSKSYQKLHQHCLGSKGTHNKNCPSNLDEQYIMAGFLFYNYCDAATLFHSSKSLFKLFNKSLGYCFERKANCCTPIDKFELSLLLRAGDIKANPGPKHQILSVSTYNSRGLENKEKLKIVLNTCHTVINKKAMPKFSFKKLNLSPVTQKC